MKIWKRVLGVTLSLVMSFELMPLALSEREQTVEDRLKEERAYSVLQKVEGTPTEQYEGYRFTEYCFEKGAPELVSFQWTLAGELTAEERTTLCAELELPELLFSEQLASLTVAHLVACYWYLNERDVTILQLVELAKDEQFFERQGISLLSEGSDPVFAPLQSEQKYYGAPFELEEGGTEQIAYTDGSLSVNVTDLTLPGVNGLDLVISRRYDSSKAKYYGQTGRLLHDCGETLELEHSASRYFYQQLSDGLLSQQGQYVSELESFYEPATFEALSGPDRQKITPTGGGFWIDEYRSQVWRCPVCSEVVETGTSENEALPETAEEGVYSLGAGWSLSFSHITTDGRKRTLHLSDGRELPIEDNGFNGLYWYMNGDLHLSYLGDMYQLTYQDGKVEEFDANGRLVEIRDRFSNRITFSYPKDALMKIVDSCGREVIFTESETETGKTLTVSVNGESFAYKLSRNTAREIGEPEYNLSAVSNMLGQETTYRYTDIEAPFSLSGELEAESCGENYVAALTEIDYPTGASVHYEYFTRVLQDFTSHGSQIGVAIRRRYEQVNGATQNEMLYNYGEYEQQPSEVDPTVQIGLKRDIVGGSTIPESDNILYSSAYDPVRGLFTLYQMSGSSGLLTNEYSFLNGKKIEEKYVLNLKYMGGSVPQKVRERVTRYNGTKSVSYTNYYAYDRNGNLLKSYERSQPGYVGMDQYGHQQLEGPLPDKSYTYDSRYGLVKRIVEPLPGGTLVTQNTLSSDGKSIVSTTVTENTSVFTYDRDGTERILSLLLEHGSTSYLYNAQGQMTRKTEQIWQEADDLVEDVGWTANYIPQTELARTSVTQYTYTGGLLTEEKNTGTGMKKTYSYDAFGRVTSEGDAAGSTSYEYDPLGEIVKITYPLGGVDSVLIDYAANTKRVHMRSGAEVLYTYDQAGRILSVKDLTSGTTLTSYGYDGVGRLLWCENADGASKGRAEYSYDHRDRETCYRMVDGEGEELFLRKKSYTDAVDYNGTGAYRISTTEYGGVSPDVTVSETYNLLGDLLQESRSNGTLTYKYDIRGNCSSVQGEKKRNYIYNYQNKLVNESSSGWTEVTRYDSQGNVVTRIGSEERTDMTYDSSGRLKSVRYPYEGTLARGVEYVYNAAGDLTGENYGQYDLDDFGLFGWTDSTSYRYDAEHNLLSAQGEGNRTMVTYSYDTAGNMLTAGGRSYTYDAYSRPVSMTDEQGATERYEYDANGNLIKTTKRSGTVIESEYNALGLVLSRTGTAPGKAAETETYSYDKRGQLISEQNSAGSWSYSYSEAGDRIEESDGNYTLKLSYRSTGDLTGYELYQNEKRVYYQTMNYQNAGDLSEVRVGNTLVASYETKNGRLYKRDRLSYGYGVYGQMTSEGETEFSYDLRGRMTEIVESDGKKRNYSYSASGELTGEVDEQNGLNKTYEYDGMGNRVRQTSGSEVTEYEYGLGNRLTAVIKGADREAYEYDADGNVTKAGTRTYEYNAFGKLIKESDGKYEWEYSYRPSGQRYRKSRTRGGSTETEYNLWLGEKLLGGLNSEKKLAWVYTYGLEKLQKTVYKYEEVWEPELSQVTGEPIILGGVEQGNWVEQRSSRTEQVAESYLGYTEATDAFGVQQEEKDGFATEVSYRGYAYDADTGKYVLPARYYDPELGRFLQEDSYWGPGNNQYGEDGRPNVQVIYQSVNRYVYCLNDPVNLTDFLGAVAGELFATMDEAAQDWGWNYFGISEYTYFEFGSIIYAVYDNKGNIIGYSYTEAVYGGSDPGQVAYKDAYGMIPENGAPAALIHSHPITHPVYSGRDKDAMAVAKIPMYLVTGNDKGGIMILKREKTSWGHKTYSINDAAPYHRLTVSEQKYWKEQLGDSWKNHLENHEGCALGVLINCKDLIWPNPWCCY